MAPKLRYRSRKDGGKTIYLDYYDNGKRVQTSTGLALVPEKTKGDKARNKIIQDEADKMRAKLELELLARTPGVESGRIKGAGLLREEVNKYLADKTGTVYTSAMKHLMQDAGENARVRDFTPQLFDRVVVRMKRELKNTTPYTYSSMIKAFARKLIREGKLNQNIEHYIKPKRTPGEEKAVLFPEEIRRIMALEVHENDLIYKQAFLFSYFTGLRWVDVVRVRPEHVQNDVLRIKLQKTRYNVRIPLNRNAQEIWSEVPKPGVFAGLSKFITNSRVGQFAARAGIDKRITFHCARVSFATNALIAGVGVYKVMKLLGHRNIKTTEIYLRIADDYLDGSTEALEID